MWRYYPSKFVLYLFYHVVHAVKTKVPEFKKKEGLRSKCKVPEKMHVNQLNTRARAFREEVPNILTNSRVCYIYKSRPLVFIIRRISPAHTIQNHLFKINFNVILPTACGLVVRVLGYRSVDPGSIFGATRFSEK
jgi:hypothetical protein